MNVLAVLVACMLCLPTNFVGNLFAVEGFGDVISPSPGDALVWLVEARGRGRPGVEFPVAKSHSLVSGPGPQFQVC